MQIPWGCPNSAICMGTTIQAWSHNEQNQVAQGRVEPPWQKASLRKLFFETYAPIVTWFAIRLMIIFSIVFFNKDFVMMYPQAPIKMDMPQGIRTTHGNSKDYMLKLEKNIYNQKQARRVWNSFLVNKLMSVGFTPLWMGPWGTCHLLPQQHGTLQSCSWNQIWWVGGGMSVLVPK